GTSSNANGNSATVTHNYGTTAVTTAKIEVRAKDSRNNNLTAPNLFVTVNPITLSDVSSTTVQPGQNASVGNGTVIAALSGTRGGTAELQVGTYKDKSGAPITLPGSGVPFDVHIKSGAGLDLSNATLTIRIKKADLPYGKTLKWYDKSNGGAWVPVS